jgi:hypothetical protein
LVERLTLTPDTLKVGDTEFKITELKKFEIEADDYLGRSKALLEYRREPTTSSSSNTREQIIRYSSRSRGIRI